MVSWEFKVNPVEPLIALNNWELALVLLVYVAEPEYADPLYTKAIPPLIAGAANAKGFKIIVPISGNNHP